MDKEKELVRHVLYIARQCLGLLDDSVWITKLHCTEEEFFKHRRAVGRVMGSLVCELMHPIYMKYPELDPYVSSPKSGPEVTAAEAPAPAEGASSPEEPGEPGPDDPKA